MKALNLELQLESSSSFLFFKGMKIEEFVKDVCNERVD
jgi:hypothetical protein